MRIVIGRIAPYFKQSNAFHILHGLIDGFAGIFAAFVEYDTVFAVFRPVFFFV